MSFNQLTAAEAERLALLAEECGEVIQAIGKVLRHGYESTHPDGGPTNMQALEREIGDVYAAVDILADCGDINHFLITEAMAKKKRKVWAYMHHQPAPNARNEA